MTPTFPSVNLLTSTFPWGSLYIVSFMSLLLYYKEPYLSLSQYIYRAPAKLL